MGNVTLSNSIVLVEDRTDERDVLKCFWLTTVLEILEIKLVTSLVSIKKNPCISVTHPILGASVHTGCCIYIPWFIWYIYYFSACSRGLFKSYYYCFIFSIRKILQILWKIFLTPSQNILEKKSLLTNIGNKCVIRQIRYVCKNSLNLDCENSFRFDIFQVL